MIKKDSQEYEFSIKDLVGIIVRYKWLIFFVSFLFLLFANLYLYFKPSIYSSYSIIEVKTRDKNIKVTDDLLQRAFYGTNKAIEKEMEILRTYEINKDVINKLSFTTQFFIKKDYKEHELYGDKIPVKISNIKILNSDIIGKSIKVELKKNGYTMSIVNSKKDIILNKLFNKVKLFQFDKNVLYSYGKPIKTKYFTFVLNKVNIKNNESNVIYFRLNGTIRNIYETIISKRLEVVQLNEDAPLIKISYEDTVPTRAKNYVNKLVEIFLKSGEINKHKKSDKILAFLKNQIDNIKKKLIHSEKELERYKVKNNIINPSIQSSALINKLSDIEVSISDFMYKKMLLDSTLESVKELNFDSIERYISRLDYDLLNSKLNTLHKLKLEEISLESEFTDEYPKLKDVKNRISSIVQNIIFDIQGLKDSIDYKISSLKKIKNKYEKDLLNIPQKEIALTELMRKHEINSHMYAYLLKKKSEKEIIKVATNSDYKIIEKAYLSKQPIKPKRSLIKLLSIFLGLLVGIFLAIIVNRTNKVLKTIEEIEVNTKLPIYGVIPYMKKRGKSKKFEISVFENPQTALADGYRKLRTDLKFSLKSNSSNIILMTSFSNSDNKASVLVNLSAIYQLSGYKVIVIDLDFYKTLSLAKYFDLEYDVGVSGYLSGKYNLSDIIFPTLHFNLDIIPAGDIPVNPSELMLSSRIKVMLDKLKERYDFILINASSITSSIDVLNVMTYADINLVVFKADGIKKEHLNGLEKVVSRYNLENIGLVIDGVYLKNKKDGYIL